MFKYIILFSITLFSFKAVASQQTLICDSLFRHSTVSHAVQVYVLARYEIAQKLARENKSQILSAHGENTNSNTMVLYLQQRQAGLSFENQVVPAGGVLDAYDISGRDHFPGFVAGPVKQRAREELDPSFKKFVDAFLAKFETPKTPEEADLIVKKLDSAIREYVATAEPQVYAKNIKDAALRELQEETGLTANFDDSFFQIGVAQSRFEKQNYSFDQWALELTDAHQAPRINSPGEARSDGYYTVYGAIEARLKHKMDFAARTWEALIEMGLIQKELSDSSVNAYRDHSARRKYYRSLIQNYGSNEHPFSELVDLYLKSEHERNVTPAKFLDFIESSLLRDASLLRGLGEQGVGFALVPIGENLIENLRTQLASNLPEICVTSDLMNPGAPRKRPVNDPSKDPMKDFPIVQISGDESYLTQIQELGKHIEKYLNTHSPIESERGHIELYYGEARRTSADGPRLPPTVFHYDSGKTLFLNVVVTLEGPLTVVDLEPPLSNLEHVARDYVYGDLLERPHHAHMTEPGFAVVNSTSTRVRFYIENGSIKVGASYHSAPDYPGSRMLINFKFKIVTHSVKY